MIIDREKVWRIFLTSLPLQALTIGLFATFLAKAVTLGAPATFTAFDWTIYDSWLRHRSPIVMSPSLAIIARDKDSEERFGAGPWDRAVLAQLIAAAREAGALAVGVDARLDHVSPAHLGGAASDALLLESLHAAGPVVFVHDPDSLLRSDAALFGHLAVSTDPDHVVRRIPLLEMVEGTMVPAFGSLLYDLSRQRTMPAGQPMATRPASMLINMIADGSSPAMTSIALSSVWDAVQHQDDRRLQELFKDRVVVILPQPVGQGPWLLPTGASVTGMGAHLQVLNSLLSENRLCAIGAFGRFGLTLLLASLVTWCLLGLRGSTGLICAGSGILLYGVLTMASLPGLHLVMPVALPLTASLFVLAGTTAWTHLTAGQRMVALERDMLRIRQEAAAVREALILRENRAEALEEDLEAAKAAIADSAEEREALTRTTASLRSQIVEAQTQEQTARMRLEQLERQIHDLREAGAPSSALGDVELERIRSEFRDLGILTQDRSLLTIARDLKRGAKSPLTVLLLGEPGTGKELFARAVHRLSPRASKTFIAVNMAAISPELFESELFGHMKGSFTGATADRRGYFELAGHGTLFLDEIGDLRLDHQSKLLRVLQDRSFYRVGATVPTTVDVRVVAATNRDLQRGVTEGWFREDLYFRLKGLVFRLPPLRERPGDIPVIAGQALADIANQMGRPVPKLSNDALRLLTEYDWPGNVRELRNALERAVALSDEMVLTRASFSLEGIATERKPGRASPSASPDSAGDAAVLSCLRQNGFDMQATANMLGWDRSTVTQRLKGLCFQAVVESHGDLERAAMAIAGDPGHLRIVELKLKDYYSHLRSVIEPFTSADDALADCRRRFKNLPDRHFASLGALVQKHFEVMKRTGSTTPHR